MAEETPSPPSQSAGKGIGSKLTKKLGPLPVWGWALVGGAVVVVVYRYYAAKKAAAASAAASTATPASVTSASDLGAGTNNTPGSNGYQDSGQLTQLQTQLAALQSQVNGGTGSGSGSSTAAPATGAYQGYGYAAPAGGYETAGGQSYQQLTTWQQLAAAASAKIPLFTQPIAGTFTPYNGAIGTAANFSQGTPLFVASSYSSGPPATSGAGGSASPVGGTAGAPAPIQPHVGAASQI